MACFLPGVSKIRVIREFAVQSGRVFDALADQDNMGRWLGAKISVPVRGADSLVGTVRRVHLGPVSFDERITSVQPGIAIGYEIGTRLPALVRHRGEVRVSPMDSQRCRVEWDVDLVLSPAFLGAPVLAGLKLLLGRGLGKLERQLKAP
jgi:uncharacterized protein YndB with AHSA1/START domain